MLRSLKRAGVTGQFAAIYSTLMPLDIVNVMCTSTAQAHKEAGAGSGCFRRLRSRCGAVRILVHGGNFS